MSQENENDPEYINNTDEQEIEIDEEGNIITDEEDSVDEDEDDSEEDDSDEDDSEDDSGSEYDDDPIIYIKPKPAWTRKRIASEDYTTDEKRDKAITTLQDFANKEPVLKLSDILEKYKISQIVTNDEGCKWVIDEVTKIISKSRRPDIIRITNVCKTLRSMLNLEEYIDEDEDEDEEMEMEIIVDKNIDISNLLLHIFKTGSTKDATPDTDPFESNTSKFKRLLTNTQSNTEDQTIKFFKTLSDEKQIHYIDLISNMKVKTNATSDIPYLLRLVDFEIDDVSKQTIFDHVSAFEKLNASSGEYNKKKNLIKAIKNLPFGKIAKLPLELEEAMNHNGPSYVQNGNKRIRTDKGKKLISYLDNVQKNIDKTIYGHVETKNQTMRLIASMISNGSAKGGHCFAMSGPPGVGKTAIAEEIAKALGRPCVKINMGGASNGDDYVGHGYTYEGSTYGLIARAMMNAGCENPVLIFDELDKVSNTAKGHEINNILIHMTDTTQNNSFQDKYLAGINIDLSKVVMIFCFNDRSNISPILLDRMKVIKVGGYKINDKVIIAKKHLIPLITKELGYKDCDYSFEDIVIRDMINQYTFEGGVRRLKELITDILMEINLRKMTGQKVDNQDPTNTMKITKTMIRDDIFKDKHPVQHTMVATLNQVGLVNGLWANSYGVGGLIPIQAHVIPTSSKFELQLTGMQGKVMEESMKVAKTVAWRLLPNSKQNELMKSWKKDGSSGVHIHCPDGATPKDGPSAGGAITTCLVSLLSNTPVDQSYAMTGEINLKGDITAIGGLEEKTFGAITAGVKTILYPLENQRDADKIREKFPSLFDPLSPTCIRMIAVDKIEQILEYVLLK